MIIDEFNYNAKVKVLKALEDDDALWQAQRDGKDVKDPANIATDKTLDWPKLVEEAKTPYDRVQKKIGFYTQLEAAAKKVYDDLVKK